MTTTKSPPPPAGRQRRLGSVPLATLNWRDQAPYSETFDDIYYSIDNGEAEAQHVFLTANQLQSRWANLGRGQSFTIAETGFGSGLNFLAATSLWFETAPDDTTLHFISIEKWPLSRQDLTTALSAWPKYAALTNALLGQYPVPVPGFHRLHFNRPGSPTSDPDLATAHPTHRVVLTLIFDEVETALNQLRSSGHPGVIDQAGFRVDAWFLDGFAPAKNPDMWTAKLFAEIAHASDPDTTFSTFTAAGAVRRGLQNAGFTVRKQAGYGSKRDMLAGVFQPQVAKSQIANAGKSVAEYPSPRRRRHEPAWYLSSASRKVPKAKRVAIIGAGIAGCCSALALARRGWQVSLYEKAGHLAAGASGNPQAVTYPRLSPESSLLSRFNLAALLFAQHYYAPFWNQHAHPRLCAGERCGVVVLPEQSRDISLFTDIAANFSNCERFVTLLTQPQLAVTAGVELDAPCGLFFPELGWLAPATLCQGLVEHRDIQIHPKEIVELQRDDESWTLIDSLGLGCPPVDAVVITASNDVKRFKQTSDLPLKPLRGQVSAVAASPVSRQLRTVVCGAGYIAPAHRGMHSFGATYNLASTAVDTHNVDHHRNLDLLARTDAKLAGLVGSPSVGNLTGRASLRCTTPDYLPLVGAVADTAQMLQAFAPLRVDARAQLNSRGHYWPDLYVHCGLGSRGFTYAPLGAELLASTLNREVPPLPRDLQIALNPARFIIRDLKRKRI